MDLTTILSQFETEEARRLFIDKAYKPGLVEIADAKIEILKREIQQELAEGRNPHYVDENDSINHSSGYNLYHVALDEAVAAKMKGNTKRADDMFMLALEHTANYDTYIKEIVKKADDENVTREAIKKLAGGDGFNLKSAAELSMQIGDKEAAREYAKRSAELLIKKGYGDSASRVYEKVGEFELALNTALTDNSFYQAFRIAKEHLPQKVPEVAQQAYQHGKNKKDYLLMARAELAVGNREEAQYLMRTKIDSLLEEPTEWGIKTAVLCAREAALPSEVVADIYHKGVAYHKKLDDDKTKKMGFQRHLSDQGMEIFKETGDASLLREAMKASERLGEYQRAKTMAVELGEPEKVEFYSALSKMGGK